ncbi:hypothetical protein FRC09_002806 [Ceratobasidium sp. 395]|nr:hypothetical protein FRC09_002806 [Ceratobasidium sp. 395]
MALTSCTPPSGDSNTTPVTLDTTDTTVSLPHSSSCRRLLKVTSAATKKIGRVIGIPGVSQVAEMAGQLIQQTSSEHHGEIANLGAHLGGILDIVNSDHSLLKRQLAESSRNLESMYRQVDEMRHSDRPLNAFRARERIEELERLSKQTEHWADRQILTHLLMQDLAAEARHIDLSSQLESIVNLKFQTEKPPLPSTRSPAPELENFPEDKIPAIDLDSIKGQEVELSYMAIDEHPCSEHCSYIVRVTCTTGLLHGVRVMRKSYNSPDQAIATRLAKRDLVSLSKYIHPNYASLKGVARDIHGQVRDIVMTTAPIAWQMFVERVDDPAAVARYVSTHSLMYATPYE